MVAPMQKYLFALVIGAALLPAAASAQAYYGYTPQ